MRDKTEEEMRERHEQYKRGFWLTATSGSADNWKSALGHFIYWSIIFTLAFFVLTYLLELLVANTPLG